MRLAAAALALAAIAAPAAAQGPNTVFGPGVQTCAQFVASFQNGRREGFRTWTLGFISALSRDANTGMGRYDRFTRRFQAEVYAARGGYETFEARLRARCRKAGAISYEEAVWREVLAMNGEPI
ncbi:MAG TPA: hypothetical protein VEA79_00050 [Phenylobacterium sp.]|nr:hypothetical protein [Phenylobacterium sp.]